MAWIPGPGLINLEKGISACTGNLIEQNSTLGPYFCISFLPNTIGLRSDEKFEKVG